MVTIDPKMVNILEHVVQSLLTHDAFLVSVLWHTPNHTPLKLRCPFKVSNQMGLGTSTLCKQRYKWSFCPSQHNEMQFILSHYFDQNVWQWMFPKLVENIAFDHIFFRGYKVCSQQGERNSRLCNDMFAKFQYNHSKLHNINPLNVTPSLMSQNPKTLQP